jgi:hypothetical protein
MCIQSWDLPAARAKNIAPIQLVTKRKRAMIIVTGMRMTTNVERRKVATICKLKITV